MSNTYSVIEILKNKIIPLLFKVGSLTKDYIFGLINAFHFPNAPLGILVIGVAFLYSIIYGGIIKNWKLLLASIVIAILLSIA